jgi:hypothetical protein
LCQHASVGVAQKVNLAESKRHPNPFDVFHHVVDSVAGWILDFLASAKPFFDGVLVRGLKVHQ